MIGCGTSTFTDPEDFGARVPGLEMDLVLTGGDPFRAHVVWLNLPRLRVVSVEERAPRVAFASLAPGKVFVTFPLRSDPASYWNGVRLERGEIVLHLPGERFHQRAGAAVRWGLIALAPADLHAYSGALLGHGLARPSGAAILRPPRKLAADLLRLHRQACRLAEEQPGLIAHHEVARALEQDLVGALVTSLGAADTINHDRTRRRHAEILARFEDVVAARNDRPVSMREFCSALGVPERTLRMCCLAFLGRSPAAYARLRRLNLARAALAQGDPVTASVETIARKHGFNEPGRFAISYRALFGETPSATLRRAHGGAEPAKFADSA